MPINPRLPDWRAEPLADELWEWLSREFPRGKDQLPITVFWPLFVQAILAHDAGAREAAVIMCRGAIESIGYTYLTHKPWKDTAWLIESQKNRKGEFVRLNFSEIRKHLIERKVLGENLRPALDRIKRDGDVAAHLSERLHESLDGLVNRPPGAPDSPSQSFLLWMSDERARRNLEDTLAIFKQVLLTAKADRARSPE